MTELNHNELPEETFIWEQCYLCNKDLIKTEDIFVDIDKDIYICQRCSYKYNLNSVPCMELNY